MVIDDRRSVRWGTYVRAEAWSGEESFVWNLREFLTI
jgi:hypothetical protein